LAADLRSSTAEQLLPLYENRSAIAVFRSLDAVSQSLVDYFRSSTVERSFPSYETRSMIVASRSPVDVPWSPVDSSRTPTANLRLPTAELHSLGVLEGPYRTFLPMRGFEPLFRG